MHAQGVRGDVIDVHRDDGRERRLPRVRTLPRCAVDQVDAHGIDPTATHLLDRCRDPVRSMQPVECAQHVGVEGLCAHRDAVHASSSEHLEDAQFGRLRVALDGDLDVRCEVEHVGGDLEHRCETLGRQQGRCPPPTKTEVTCGCSRTAACARTSSHRAAT